MINCDRGPGLNYCAIRQYNSSDFRENGLVCSLQMIYNIGTEIYICCLHDYDKSKT